MRELCSKYTFFAVILFSGILLIFVVRYDSLLQNNSRNLVPRFKQLLPLLQNAVFQFKQTIQQENKEFVILWYNSPFYVTKYLSYTMPASCPVSNCRISRQPRDLNVSDAVIFAHDTIPGQPPRKREGQRWIFFSIENPYFTVRRSNNWDHKFDWTMSYRYDSDFPYPYFKLERRTTPLTRNYSLAYRKKTKGAVWMSGHCPVPSQRQAFAKKLQKQMDVDMFGRCGTKPCGVRSPFINDCLTKVAREYKFYFSFENALCKDYTTEKLHNIYTYNLEIIPVINGPWSAANYLPKGTYISALDYNSTEDLVKALKDISADENKYIQYLKEKDKYYDIGIRAVTNNTMCNLCLKLNTLSGPNVMIKNPWDQLSKNACVTPTF